MTAIIIKLPVRRRPPKVTDHPKVRKALSLIATVDLYLFNAMLKTVEAFDRTR